MHYYNTTPYCANAVLTFIVTKQCIQFCLLIQQRSLLAEQDKEYEAALMVDQAKVAM